MDRSISDATWMRHNAHHPGTGSSGDVIAGRMKRWRYFLSGVAIGLACCYFVDYVVMSSLVTRVRRGSTRKWDLPSRARNSRRGSRGHSASGSSRRPTKYASPRTVSCTGSDAGKRAVSGTTPSPARPPGNARGYSSCRCSLSTSYCDRLESGAATAAIPSCNRRDHRHLVKCGDPH